MAERRKDDASSPDLFGSRAESKPAAAPPSPAQKDHRHGHRDRLRSRFMSGDAGALHDYEMLELILFRAIPRRDVKPLAKQLLERFSDFAGVLSAPAERLREVSGLGDAAILEIKIVQAAAQRLAQARMLNRTEMTSFDAVVEYSRVVMGHEDHEQFRVFFLDRKSRLLADELQSRGTVDQVAAYPREVAKRALELGASAVIIAHNHPSGDATPSQADIKMTARVAAALSALDVALHDHVIISHRDASSLRALGHI